MNFKLTPAPLTLRPLIRMTFAAFSATIEPCMVAPSFRNQ